VLLLVGLGTSLLVVGSHMTPLRSPPLSPPYEWAAADAAKDRGSGVGFGYSFRYDGRAVVVPCALAIRLKSTGFRGIVGAVRSGAGVLTGSGSVSLPGGGTAYGIDAEPSPALKQNGACTGGCWASGFGQYAFGLSTAGLSTDERAEGVRELVDGLEATNAGRMEVAVALTLHA
jgi:hypothetical protein